MRLPAFVCLSVCLLARLFKNAQMDLDETLCVDRCRDIWRNWLTFEPGPDNSPDAGTGLLSPISYALQRAECYEFRFVFHCNWSHLVSFPR